MTTTVERPVDVEASDAAVDVIGPAEPRPADRGRPKNARRASIVLTVTGTLTLVSLVLLGFIAYLFGLSRLQENRAQVVMYRDFAHTLSAATAPTGTLPDGTPIAPGTSVAVMNIPAIGMKNAVVVEGTSARDLVNGPGHRRDTPLPGQYGVSVIDGRRATFGGPFGSLTSLKIGDPIQVITGQGRSTYVVKALGHDGLPPVDASANRIVLTTADSGYIPSTTYSVSADLQSKPQNEPGALPLINSDELPLRGAFANSVLPLLLWGWVLVVVAVVGTVAARRWKPLPTYVCMAPIVLAVLWNVYQNVATMLPNIY